MNTLLPSGGVKFFTFAVGSGATCAGSSGGRGNLQDIANLTGGSCTNVPDPSSLPSILPGVVASQLTSLQMTVDGNPATIDTISAALPQNGPVSVTYSTTIAALNAGSHTICTQANGSDGGGAGSVTDCHTITVNAPPTANAGGPYTGDEGSSIAISGTAADPDGDALTTTWSYTAGGGVDGGATCSFSDASALTTTIACTDDGSYTLTLTVSDGITPAVTSNAALTVANVNPTLSITAPAPGSLSAVNTAVSLAASFADAGANDTHTCSINWDDGNPATAGTVAEASGSGTCTGSITFTAAGVYTIQVTVTDDDGGAATESVMVVVYDPSAGFVTGGGWLESPAGAYQPDPSLTGRADFGFVSKYQRGATTPTGQTEFQFKAASLNFHSSGYQWLIVSGPLAQYKGDGTLNGVSGYSFLLTARDGQASGGGGVDKFRIKIWETAGGTLVYDNALGASDDIDAADPQAIASGSIVIHN